MSRVLVTGGAGYVGSHIVRRLLEAGREVVVLDDLSEGHRAAVDGVPIIEADCGDESALAGVFRDEGIRYVVHMAASSLVGESMADPGKYYRNNVLPTLALLEASRLHRVGGVVFSSTAAVYGDPEEVPIREDHRLCPTNPYGETKLVCERAMQWYRQAHGVRYVALRYFNAAGAHPSGQIGEDHAEETHLIPRLLASVRDNGPATPLFGADYPTRDGTCIRDYVHVVDLAEAHVTAIEAIERGTISGESINLGNGEGFSVREVVDAVASVTGRQPRIEEAPRRPGDPAVLVASSERARKRLGWTPRYRDLRDIVRTAWSWHESHPGGYGC